MTLPLELRNRLADLILDAFHDQQARRRLAAVSPSDGDERAAEVAERVGRARRALGDRPLDPRDPSLPVALSQAAVLFDARLYFEVHERLEPYWLRASGADRLALQGVIQVAVGFHHLENGNAAGARALLHDGAAKLLGRRVERIDLDSFAKDALRCLDEVNRLGAGAGAEFDWSSAPRFPLAAERD